MSFKRSLYSYTFSILFLFGLSSQTIAQLQANFTIDVAAGCSPLSVQFSNTSTGTTATTTYQWSFGNGNSSALKDPGATFYDEKTYTVSLTAKDGGVTSIKTLPIVVYKKPSVDFSVSPGKGCVPLTTSFTANATPGDGSINKYFWDFGDGDTQQAGTAVTSHTYTFGQKPPVSLTVTNSYGCYTNRTKSDLVEAFKSVTASFKTASNTLCNPGDEVTFTNTSTGSGSLTYAWDFGDGKTAVEISPKHVYSTGGTYTVKLTVKSSDGCSADAIPLVINVANFVVDFELPTQICETQVTRFVNKSTANFSLAEWEVDGFPYNSYNNEYPNLPFTFYQAGEHTVTLTATYGNCKVPVTKKINVNPLLAVSGFVADLQEVCGVPLTIKFKDTTAGAVKWNWSLNTSPPLNIGNTQEISYTFNAGTVEFVYLSVTNKEGCTTKVGQLVNYAPPEINIYLKNYGGYGAAECTGSTFQFAAKPDSIIKAFNWNFGDGSSSTEKEPFHTFNKPGSFQVKLSYITNNGCAGSVTYYNFINIIDKPKFDFAVVGSTTICGNTPTTLNVTPATSDWAFNWTFNGNYLNYNGTFWGDHIDVKFNYDTTYTVQMTAGNGYCRDTVTKINYLKVLPPFPKINQFFYTCDDTRGLVRFTESSFKAAKWSWDFGDGQVSNYTIYTDTVRHLYTKTGTYNVVLSNINGPCTVKDSVVVYVLLKQKPILSLAKTDACASDVVNWVLSGLEPNPGRIWFPYQDYYISGGQYNDPIPDLSSNFFGISNYYWSNQTTGTIERLTSGKTGLRFFLYSQYYNCTDTSNFVSIKIHGPTAGFMVLNYKACFKETVSFKDTSQSFNNIAIKEWKWDFGDNTTITRNTGGTVTHLYKDPGNYLVSLTVTDNDGCSNTTEYNLHAVSLGGPKADFFASSYDVVPNTVVNFYNNSASFDSYSSNLVWVFPDGSRSNDQNPTFNFVDEGLHEVKLITTNNTTVCPDTAVKTIRVRKVNSAFTYTLSYINNNSCPPVVARFTSVAENAVRLAWGFGDGGTGGDQQIVSHTFNTAGIYRVVHYSYDANGAVDSTEDFIEIKGPYALLQADTFYACNALEVKLSAEVKNANNFTWDFGDGTLTAGKDTFATHKYLTPGIYRPALILKDAGGCSATSSLAEKIVIDSLSATFNPLPAAACTPALIQFTPQVYSLAFSAVQSPLQYRWLIAVGSKVDTVFTENVSHLYTVVGQHTISLQVSSAYGCKTNALNKVDVRQGIRAIIQAPLQICVNDTAVFKGSTLSTGGNLQWAWNFGNNAGSTLQNPVQKFSPAGQQLVTLVVSNGNCADTATYILPVIGLPVITFSLSRPVVCLGDTVTITAGGANTYLWQNSRFIQNRNQPTTGIWPVSDTFYSVKATNTFGCSSADSLAVKVINPIKLSVQTPVFACFGFRVSFNATGADKYQWLPAAGLSNANIANPVAALPASANYTVVGYDNYNCFTDSAKVMATIGPLPVVNAGPDFKIIGGSSITLRSVSSNDVVKWTWQPVDYLSCSNCASPVSTPTKPVNYILTVATAQGCTARDTMRVELICKSDLIYIPTGFTPNGDNLNERFAILGSGIKSIVHLAVYDRWGKTVFERKNVNPFDRNSSWDGKAYGQPAPSGAYVYVLKIECEGGAIFSYQGAVTLIR